MFTMVESITGPVWDSVAWRGVSCVYRATCDLFKEKVLNFWAALINGDWRWM